MRRAEALLPFIFVMQSEQTQFNIGNEQGESPLRGLNSYKRAVREAHLRQVCALPPESLLLLMQEGARLYRKRYRLSSCVELILLVPWLPISIALFAVANVSVNLFGWFFLFTAFTAIAWHVCTVPWRMYRALVGVLEHTNDLHLVGPAISMYVRPDSFGQTHIALGNALCRLLPQLRSDHASLLTSDQMQDLLKLLAAGNYSENASIASRKAAVMLQALKALEQIGDESAIPVVQNLTSTTLNQNIMVRQAAEQCLEYLRLNAGRQREMQTLLRASSSAAAAPDTLLRPASSNGETAPEQLLRPQA
jgi:hypothetical protein